MLVIEAMLIKDFCTLHGMVSKSFDDRQAHKNFVQPPTSKLSDESATPLQALLETL
jgi:hypothetical protein